MTRIQFLNTEIDNLTLHEVLNKIDEFIVKKNPTYIVTPNVDHIVKLEDDLRFQEVYKHADLILTDGMPLIWISKLLKNPIKEKISGSDLFPQVCKLCSNRGYKVFLLGAKEGVAQVAASKLKEKYLGLNICGVYSPPFGFEEDSGEIDKIINLINTAKPDVLAVGLGAPKQELFIYNYKDRLNVPVSLAIGASIDFEADNIKRAPIIMQKMGLEWLYRLYKEPKRMYKRYLIDDMKIFKIVFSHLKGGSK